MCNDTWFAEDWDINRDFVRRDFRYCLHKPNLDAVILSVDPTEVFPTNLSSGTEADTKISTLDLWLEFEEHGTDKYLSGLLRRSTRG
jgi:hypothetical protein